MAVDRLTDVTSITQLTVRLEKLDEMWDKVNDTILDIETHEDFSDEDEVHAKKRSEFNRRYYDVMSLLLDKVKEFEETNLNKSFRNLDSRHVASTNH